MDGPYAGFDADFFLAFGTGVEVRIGRHWNAGVLVDIDKAIRAVHIGGSQVATEPVWPRDRPGAGAFSNSHK